MEGSGEEKEARRALARELYKVTPLNISLRRTLAELIDPDEDLNPRCIRFANRRKGKQTKVLAEREIAEFIWSQRRAGEKMESIKESAKNKFGLKKSRVLAIWGQWQPILRRLKRSDLKDNPVDPFA